MANTEEKQRERQCTTLWERIWRCIDKITGKDEEERIIRQKKRQVKREEKQRKKLQRDRTKEIKKFEKDPLHDIPEERKIYMHNYVQPKPAKKMRLIDMVKIPKPELPEHIDDKPKKFNQAEDPSKITYELPDETNRNLTNIEEIKTVSEEESEYDDDDDEDEDDDDEYDNEEDNKEPLFSGIKNFFTVWENKEDPLKKDTETGEKFFEKPIGEIQKFFSWGKSDESEGNVTEQDRKQSDVSEESSFSKFFSFGNKKDDNAKSTEIDKTTDAEESVHDAVNENITADPVDETKENDSFVSGFTTGLGKLFSSSTDEKKDGKTDSESNIKSIFSFGKKDDAKSSETTNPNDEVTNKETPAFISGFNKLFKL